MPRWFLQMVALIVVALAAAACESVGLDVLSPQQGAILVNKIQIGMNREEVTDQLGKPQKQETHEATEFLFYTTNWIMADAALQRSPIAIRDGKVVGLGKAYLETFTNRGATWGGWLGQVSPSE